MISVTVLALIIAFASSIYVNFFGSVRNLRAANQIYEEARFTMERVIREVRNGTIDYEEYFNQNLIKQQNPEFYETLAIDEYTKNYCDYSRQFYTLGPDGKLGTLDDESIGERAKEDTNPEITRDIPPAIGRLVAGDDVPDPIQNDLFLINISGDERTYIKRIEKDGIGRIGMVKLKGGDFGVD
jgi:hypothetical protein